MPYYWTTEENEYLLDRVGTMPIRDLVASVKRYQRTNGLPVRSSTAIRSYIRRLGCSEQCIYDRMTKREWARQLGVSYNKFRYWEIAGLKVRSLSRKQTAIRLCDMRKFLEREPWRANEADYDALVGFFGRKLADRIKASKPPRSKRGQGQAVINSDGVIYASVRDAARKTWVDPTSIMHAIARGGTCCGKTWRYVS